MNHYEPQLHDMNDAESEASKFSQLSRRGFIFSAAASMVGTMASCSTPTSSLSAGRKRPNHLGRQPHLSNHSHLTYASYLESLRLKNVQTEKILAPHRRVRGNVRNHLPPKSLWGNMAPTLRVADEIARRTGAELTEVCSAYRSPSYNRYIGGASKSQHMRNTALDLKFACGSWQASKVARHLRDAGYFTGGVGIYSGFLHIDTRGENQTWWG